MGILGGLGFASIFYFAAEYEHMTGWKWALASIALSATVKGLFSPSPSFSSSPHSSACLLRLRG